MEGGGSLALANCTVRDHDWQTAYGVYVAAGSNATVGADCVFARNARGDVVRQGEGGGEGGVKEKQKKG